MIIARATNGALVDADQADRSTAYACPLCAAGPLTLKRGAIVVPHFAHPPSAACTEHEPESAIHIAMKRAAQELFGGRIEHTVGDRRADVYSDAGIVVECQASPISIEEVAQRTADWNAAGCEVLWIWNRALAGKLHSCHCHDEALFWRDRLHVPNRPELYGHAATREWRHQQMLARLTELRADCFKGCEHRIPASILATAVEMSGYARIVIFNPGEGRIMAADLRYARYKKTIRRLKIVGYVDGGVGTQMSLGGPDRTIWSQHITHDRWNVDQDARRLPPGLRLTTPTRYTRR